MSDKRDFERVFKSGTRSSDRLFSVLGAANGLRHARLGLAVSRKAAVRSVDRNRLKRIAREAFRVHAGALAGLDVVVLARPGAGRTGNGELRESLERHYRTLPERCEPC